jgi:serine/threonine-protein kinase
MAKIGHFELLELVGRGAMGTVYRAVDPIIGRLVAIKVIRLVGYNDGEEAAFLKERLFKEARVAGSLSHPGIVTVHQLGTQDDQAYIVMEYIDGSTLESRLDSRKLADPSLRSRVLLEVAAALDYAHQRSVVHRDIKPANIMITAAGTVKITDFGIAKTLLGHTVTKTGMIRGTPFYMSPEQVRGAALDGRSDQFALAVIAYQMLAGRRPFEGDHVTSICYQIVHSEPPSVADLQPGVPPAVAREC